MTFLSSKLGLSHRLLQIYLWLGTPYSANGLEQIIGALLYGKIWKKIRKGDYGTHLEPAHLC